MPPTASYKHHFNPPAPAESAQNTSREASSFMAYGLNDGPRHRHDWRCKPGEQQPLAAENKLIWHCSGCNELKTLFSWQKP